MRPEVTIIIPFRNNYSSLNKTIESIYKKTPNQSYNLIVVDDCSVHSDTISKVANKVIRLEKHSGFSEAVNEGIKQAVTNWLVVMHADAAPLTIHWLVELQRTMERLKESGVKFVSSRVTGLGSTIDTNKEILYTSQYNDTEKNFVVSKCFLPWISCLFHKELISKIGYLKKYSYAWHEDIEFYYRMNYYGYKQAIAYKSIVEHSGGVSVNSLSNKLIKEMESKKEMCWADVKKYIK